MDLTRLLGSLEEFLYELVGWLVFYPRTLWRVLVRPGELARYTRRESVSGPVGKLLFSSEQGLLLTRNDVGHLSAAGFVLASFLLTSAFVIALMVAVAL